MPFENGHVYTEVKRQLLNQVILIPKALILPIHAAYIVRDIEVGCAQGVTAAGAARPPTPGHILEHGAAKPALGQSHRDGLDNSLNLLCLEILTERLLAREAPMIGASALATPQIVHVLPVRAHIQKLLDR